MNLLSQLMSSFAEHDAFIYSLSKHAFVHSKEKKKTFVYQTNNNYNSKNFYPYHLINSQNNAIKMHK